ncbi:MAG: hypothetical protein NTY15_07220 [Planctomycetota bacterium]|jgi:hypothetical protein|nr:hypothetical protein [Planctomycetota bacterium]
MNRFISVVMILIILVVCVGFFRGWFSMTTNNEPLTEKLDVHFQVDRDKMKQDANAVEEKTKSVLNLEKKEDQVQNAPR